MSTIFLRPTFSEPWKADMIIINGNILTVDEKDSCYELDRERGGIAVKDGYIGEVGYEEDIKRRRDSSTIVVDLQGRTVTPGIIDSHLHLMTAGELDELYIDLRDMRSIAEIQQAVTNAATAFDAERVHALDADKWWVNGYGYILNLEDERFPDKNDLTNNITLGHPVFLTSRDGHYGSCDRHALSSASDILRVAIATSIRNEETGNPTGILREGGIIELEDGRPTGVFFNHPAMNLVRQHIKPQNTIDDYVKSLKSAFDFHIANGITSYHDPLVILEERYEAYKKVDKEALIPMRASLYYMSERYEDVEQNIEMLEKDSYYQGNMVRFSGWKLQVDGTFLTAYTYDPHLGVSNQSVNWENQIELNDAVLKLHNTGKQVKIHCVGDRAIDMSINAIEFALDENPREDHRHRLEHLILPTDDALDRIKELGIVVSYQPAIIFWGAEEIENLYDRDGNNDPLIASYPPTTRSKRFARLKTLLDDERMRNKVCINTDYPSAAKVEPQLTLYSAVARRSIRQMIEHDSEPGFYTDECISIQQALRCYTYNAAYAAHEESIKGSIQEGKVADFTIWSDNMYTIETPDLLRMKVEMTIIGGEIKYPKKSPIKITRGK